MPQTNAVTVLVVGKGAAHLSDLIRRLESLNCRVVWASGVTNWVLPVIEACRVPLVFCDMELEKGEYTELIDALRSARVPAKLVVTCRVCRMADYCEAMQVGAYDYLCAPFERTELARILHNVSSHRPTSAQRLESGAVA